MLAPAESHDETFVVADRELVEAEVDSAGSEWLARPCELGDHHGGVDVTNQETASLRPPISGFGSPITSSGCVRSSCTSRSPGRGPPGHGCGERSSRGPGD